MTHAELKSYEAHLETINPKAMDYAGIHYSVCNLRDISHSLETVNECVEKFNALEAPKLPEVAAFFALYKSQAFFAQNAMNEFIDKTKEIIESALVLNNACEDVEVKAKEADLLTSTLCSVASGYSNTCKEALYRAEEIVARNIIF